MVTTGKAFKAAKRDGSASSTSHALEARIPLAVEKFNAILDELESEVVRFTIRREVRALTNL